MKEELENKAEIPLILILQTIEHNIRTLTTQRAQGEEFFPQ
jgi:hypothetical protein